ncbi:MAG: hypothetical protein IH943_09975 [Acidobacteria bacterium]|nr:hypothetical protein [Acidobacteriota bacterium]
MIRRVLTLVTLLVLFMSVGALVGLAAVVNISSGSFYYEDATVGDGRITAKVGDQLRFVTEDAGKGTPHTVEIPGLGISSGPLATNSTYVTVAITKPGEYQVFCKPHRKKGHETTLVVTGQALTTTTTATATTQTDQTATTQTDQTATTQTDQTTTTDSTTTTLGSTTSTTGATGPGSGSGDSTDVAVASGATDDTIPVGVSKPETPEWTRILPAAAFALIPLTAIAVLAGRRSQPERSLEP